MDNLTPITREEMLMNDEPLTPITREEKILAGEDLTPVTRREYFLKKYRHAGGDVMVEGLSVTENGTYTAPEGKAYSPVNVNVPLPENAYLLKETSGSLVSFSDGADLPMPSFICNITANQDLHGYDTPWVGGAGKNKLVYPYYHTTRTSGGILFTDNGDGSITLTNSATDNGFFSLELSMSIPNGNYIFRLNTQGGDSTSLYIRMQINSTDSTTNYLPNTDIPITVTNNQIYNIQIRVQTGGNPNGCVVYPFLRLSTDTDTNWSPYSNICPISGHTGVEANVSPTTEASAGTTYSVSWQTEAGEVFGGYVDLVSGELVVTEEKLHFDNTNSSLWSGVATSNQGITRAYTVPSYSDREIVLSDSYIKDLDFNTKLGGININAQGRIIITPPFVQGKSLEEFKAELTTYPFDVVMTLATPIEYQLTPTQIKSLLGNNNAWCDTGEVDIDYFAKEV